MPCQYITIIIIIRRSRKSLSTDPNRIGENCSATWILRSSRQADKRRLTPLLVLLLLLCTKTTQSLVKSSPSFCWMAACRASFLILLLLHNTLPSWLILQTLLLLLLSSCSNDAEQKFKSDYYLAQMKYRTIAISRRWLTTSEREEDEEQERAFVAKCDCRQCGIDGTMSYQFHLPLHRPTSGLYSSLSNLNLEHPLSFLVHSASKFSIKVYFRLLLCPCRCSTLNFFRSDTPSALYRRMQCNARMTD